MGVGVGGGVVVGTFATHQCGWTMMSDFASLLLVLFFFCGFFSGSLPQKTNTFKYQFDLDAVDEEPVLEVLLINFHL